MCSFYSSNNRKIQKAHVEVDDVLENNLFSGMGSDHSNASLVDDPHSVDVVMSESESSHTDLHKLRPRTSTQ